MAVFMVDRNALTLTIHKEDCPQIPRSHLQGPGSQGEFQQDDQLWLCEANANTRKIAIFTEGRFWCIVTCGSCFETGR